jgi:hypothetical protein
MNACLQNGFHYQSLDSQSLDSQSLDSQSLDYHNLDQQSLDYQSHLECLQMVEGGRTGRQNDADRRLAIRGSMLAKRQEYEQVKSSTMRHI